VLPTVPKLLLWYLVIGTLGDEFILRYLGSGRTPRIGTLEGESSANNVSNQYRDDAAKHARTAVNGHEVRPRALYIQCFV